jgi:hypothetical protein
MVRPMYHLVVPRVYTPTELVGHPIRMGDGRWTRDDRAACVGSKRGSSVRTDAAFGAVWVLGGGSCVGRVLGIGAQARGDKGTAGALSCCAGATGGIMFLFT